MAILGGATFSCMRPRSAWCSIKQTFTKVYTVDHCAGIPSGLHSCHNKGTAQEAIKHFNCQIYVHLTAKMANCSGARKKNAVFIVSPVLVVYIYIYIYIYIHTHIYIYIHTHIYVYIYLFICIYIFFYIFV